MNNKTDIDVQYVSPLKKICMTIGELPSSYLETMSYYEMLVWFTEFLKNQVIPTVNNNAEAVQELQALYEELRTYVNNYFDNLDVQEEINNKLDDMLESGQLDQVIEQYLQSTALWCFDTIADLKAATNLIDGSFAKTMGALSVNDGGHAVYRITDTVPSSYYEELDNGLYAELIFTRKTYSSLTFGDSVSENASDGDLITRLVNLSSANNICIKMVNKTYNIEHETKILSNTNIDFNNAILKIKNNTNCCAFINLDNYDEATSIIENITLKNFNFDGNASNNYSGQYSTIFLDICNAKNIVIDNFTITNTVKNALYFYECSDIKITNGESTNTGIVESTPNYETSLISINNRGGSLRPSTNIVIDNLKASNYCYGIIFILNCKIINIRNCEITNGLSSPYRSIPLTLTQCEFIEMSNINVDTTSSVAFEINQNTKYLNVENMQIKNSGQPLTFGPNTIADSISEHIKFTNCCLDKSTNGTYMMAINNAKHVIFENCFNTTSSGIASTYTLVDDIVFKDCNFNINFSNFYLQKNWKIENSTINDLQINNLNIAIPSSFPKIDILIPYEMTGVSTLDLTLPFNFATNYNISCNLDVFSVFASNGYYQYFAKYLYKISTNGSDVGTIVDLTQKIGDNYYKITPTATVRNKITVTKTAGENIKGYIHLYN